jgi:hypothetical protein
LLLAVVDIESLCAADAGFTHTARDHGSVTRHTATCSNDRLRCNHAVKIVGTGFLSHEHDAFAFTGHLFGFVRTEHNLTLGRARTRRQPRSQHSRICFWIDSRMQ